MLLSHDPSPPPATDKEEEEPPTQGESSQPPLDSDKTKENSEDRAPSPVVVKSKPSTSSSGLTTPTDKEMKRLYLYNYYHN